MPESLSFLSQTICKIMERVWPGPKSPRFFETHCIVGCAHLRNLLLSASTCSQLGGSRFIRKMKLSGSLIAFSSFTISFNESNCVPHFSRRYSLNRCETFLLLGKISFQKNPLEPGARFQTLSRSE